MTRLASLFVLAAVVITALLALDPVGRSAILFSFVGMPCLALGRALHALKRWRDGAFSGNHPSRKELR